MSCACWQCDVSRERAGIFQDVAGFSSDPVSADVDFSFGTDEGESVAFSLETAMFDSDSVFVPECQGFAVIVSWRADFDGAALVCVHGPLHDIEVMCAPVGEDASGVVDERAPASRVES